MYLNISLWGGFFFFFFFQSQANQIPFFCFLSRKWQIFSNYRRLWASAWKFILVFSCCFSHAIFSLQEMPRTYWYCGWSWKLPSLPLSRGVLVPTPGLYEAQQCCSGVGGHTGPGSTRSWERAACKLPSGCSCQRSPKPSESWGGRSPGTRPQFRESHFRKATFFTWPCTHLSSS